MIIWMPVMNMAIVSLHHSLAMKLKIILGILLFSAFVSLLFYIKALKADNERLNLELNLAINANKSLEASLNESLKRHEKELRLLSEARQDEKEVQEKIIKVKEYVYKSNENNLTKLFNDVVSRLWTKANTNAN